MRTRKWEKVTSKFKPSEIKSAVRKILEIYDRAGILDVADKLDWGVAFENIADFDDIDSFVKYLQEEHYIPSAREIELLSKIDEKEQKIKELKDRLSYIADYVQPAEVRADLKETLSKLFPTLDEYLSSLRSRRKRILAKAKYEKRIAELERQNRKLEQKIREYEQYVGELEERKPRVKYLWIKFLEPVERFTGVDGVQYGPYSPGDVAKIPAKDAEKLLKTRVATSDLEAKIPVRRRPKPRAPTPPPRELQELKDELRRLWARFVDARMRRDYDTAREILREYARIHEKAYGKPSSMRHGGREYRYRKLILRNLIAEWRDRFREIPREEAYLAAEKELLDWMESFLHP